LSSIYFWQNKKKLAFNSLANYLGKNKNLAKLTPMRKDTGADPGWHQRGQGRWEGEKNKE
jgi:hypothetical protein